MKIAGHIYEEELDEMLLANNPSGGRPREIGGILFQDDDRIRTYEVSKIQEETMTRYFLGYCQCGRRVVIGQKRAEVLSAALQYRNVKARIPRVSWKLRLARVLART